MMLTVKQPAQYGYKSVHDLPTPPSASRPSPPLIFQDTYRKPLPAVPRSHSPSGSGQPMAAPHRGLPPPAAMTMPPQPPQPAAHSHAPPPGPSPLAHASSMHHSMSLAALPPPPPQWQGAEEAMKNWLATKSEEERRKQEEERTRQESLRLDQRKVEFEQSKLELEQKRTVMDILQKSLSSGVPPPLVPVIFASMASVAGSGLSQAALEWAQQFLSQGPGHAPQLLPPGQMSPNRRDSQPHPYGQYSAVPSTPGSAPAHGGYSYPGSPTRARGHSVSVAGSAARTAGQVGNLPNLNTNVPLPGAPVSGQTHTSQPSSTAAPQEVHASPSIYFHHWQPPTSQAGSSSAQPATPSVAGDSPRKRKATGSQPPVPPPSAQHRFRSPPFTQQGSSSTLSNPPLGRRRGHSRQRSDLSTYRSSIRGRSEGLGTYGGQGTTGSIPGATYGGPREGISSDASAQQGPRSGGGHSVSSLLSDEPPQATPRRPNSANADQRLPMQQATSPPGDDKTRGGAAGSAATREG